jgi:hypothetical protein
METPMRESSRAAEVPRATQELVLGYLNTCRVMSKLWIYVMAVLAAALPLGFYGAGHNHIEALVYGAGFWFITGILSRLAVFEFRQLRAGWVARKVGRRIRTGTPAWEALVLWIAENNDGDYLNTVLKKLGVSPRSVGIYATPLRESLRATVPQVAEMAGEFFEKLVPSESGSTQTYVCTTTKTQMLNDDGEWVTVDSETSRSGEPPSDYALRRALSMLEEAHTAVPAAEVASRVTRREGSIPLSSTEEPRTRGRERPDYMPLELDEFDPAEDEDEEAAVGASKGRGGD